MGRLADAVPAWRELAAFDERRLGAGHALARYSRAWLGYALALVGDREAGALEMEAATAALDEADVAGADADMLAKVIERRAQVALLLGDAVAAATGPGGWRVRWRASPCASADWRGRVETLQGEVALAAGDAAAALALRQRTAGSIDANEVPRRHAAGRQPPAGRRARRRRWATHAAASRLAAEGRALLEPLAYPHALDRRARARVAALIRRSARPVRPRARCPNSRVLLVHRIQARQGRSRTGH